MKTWCIHKIISVFTDLYVLAPTHLRYCLQSNKEEQVFRFYLSSLYHQHRKEEFFDSYQRGFLWQVTTKVTRRHIRCDIKLLIIHLITIFIVVGFQGKSIPINSKPVRFIMKINFYKSLMTSIPGFLNTFFSL